MTEIVTRQELSARDIVVGYGKNDSILEGLSSDMSTGEPTVIVGPNARGKSTLLRSPARVLDVRFGVVKLGGRGVANINQKALARRLSLLAQSSVALGDMFAEDLAACGRYPYQPLPRQWSRENDEAVVRAIEDAGVAPLAGYRIGELSGGRRQYVWIAMALAQSTEILLLDEPTTYLDLNHQLEVLYLAERLRRAGTMVVAVLHDLHLAFRYATYLVFMKNDEIVVQGTPHDVVTVDLAERVFSVSCRIIDDSETGSSLVIPTRRSVCCDLQYLKC